MRMTIEQMRIQNFKGCRDLSIDFSNETNIFGMNGTGKSTIPDAFSWLLFNKDSHGNAPGSDNFREKPLNEDGKEVHNLDTTVELICKLDGSPFNLRRTQREKWVKKRGNAEAVFQGNESTYWINDVETKLSDFKARIAQITSEEVFRLIASLSAFNQLEWKKRRKQLLDMSDADVDGLLLAQDKYRRIADEAGTRGIGVDDLRKVLVDLRKRENEELRMIPVRIDEARLALPDLDGNKIKAAEYMVADTKADIERIDGYIAQAQMAGSETGAGHRQQLLALEAELVSLKRRVLDDHEAKRRHLRQDEEIASAELRRKGAELAREKQDCEIARERAEKAEAERLRLRQEFVDLRDTTQVVDTTCPFCGQQLPDESIEEARAKVAEERKAKLAEIKERGVKAAADVVLYSDKVKLHEKTIAALEVESKAALIQRDEAYAALMSYPDVDYSVEPRIKEVEQQIISLRYETQAPPDEKITKYNARKNELQEILARNMAVLASRDSAVAIRERIAELEAKQKELGAHVSDIEQLIVLVEQFVQDRCGALEESINARFPSVRWKLFDVQINGGIVDTCICMIPCNGHLVAYECANTASQINADIEIINTLSKHYDLQLPLFVDNSERVNVLAHTDSQLITLAVSTDSRLRIEHKEAI